jgi:hypothetical protein
MLQSQHPVIFFCEQISATTLRIYSALYIIEGEAHETIARFNTAGQIFI